VLLDYLPARWVGLVLFSGQAVAVLILLSGAGGPAPYVVAALLGFATGGEGDLMPYVLSRRFGAPAYGRIYGTAFALFNLGTLIGPLAMGNAFARLGSYDPALMVFCGLSLTATALVFFSAGGRASPAPAATAAAT
jgi:hypothetical protein